MTNSLKSKAQKSIRWTVIKTLFSSIVQPFYRILLALLLLPSEFAYIAVITLIVSFAELLNNVGVGEAVIQRDNVTRKDLSSLFIFNLIITLVLVLVLYLSSSLIELFYSMQDLELIIKVISLVVLINGSTSLFKFYLHKEFFFKETSIIQIVKIIIEILVSISLILFGYGIWGFVFGVVFSTLIHGLLLSFIVFKKTEFRIIPFISFKNLSRFLSFGIFIGSKKILTFLSHRIDEIIIGGVFSSEMLGSYYLAKNILLQIQTLITTSFGQVLLPVFSKIKHDKVKLNYYYSKVLSLVSFVGFPVFIGIILTASIFVPLIFGQEWMLSILVFQLLAIPTLAILLNAGVSTSLMYSVNKASLAFKVDLVFVTIYILLLLLFHNGEIMNVIGIYSIYVIIKFIVIQYFVSRILHINIISYFYMFKGIIISTVLMSIIVLLFIVGLGGKITNITLLILSVSMGIIVYVISSLIFNRNQTMGTVSIIKNIINLK